MEIQMKKLDVSLHADEPLRTGLLRIADCLIQNAVDRIRCPTSDRGEDVHLVRVTIKRLRAMLRLIRPVVGKTAFDRENNRLRTAARRLSAARDADVARQTLATLPSPKGRERDAVAIALAGFGKDGEPEADINKTMSQIELDLEQTRRNLHQLRISEREWKAIEPGLRRAYRQCRKRMERALGQGDDDAFHKWRIRVKNLYYELQLLQSVWPVRLNKMVAGLGQLQDKIGADHDLGVLKRSLCRNPDTFGGTQSVEQVLNSLDARRRKLRRITKPLGRAIFDQRPRIFVRELGQHWNNWRKITTVDLR
jgi:CHAD domain-containing protein